jgi:photosystem II stability/assembly factor-like uncharacterized protein
LAVVSAVMSALSSTSVGAGVARASGKTSLRPAGVECIIVPENTDDYFWEATPDPLPPPAPPDPWQNQTTFPYSDDVMEDLWGSGPPNGQQSVYVVGRAGLLLRSVDEGAAWQRLKSGTGRDLFAITGRPPPAGSSDEGSDLWAVGARGTIVHSSDGGQHFVSVASGTQHDLCAVWLAPTGDVYAAGGGGTLLHAPAGGAFAPLESGTTANLHAVWGPAHPQTGAAVLVAGEPETLLRSLDGVAFTAVELPEATANANANANAAPATQLSGDGTLRHLGTGWSAITGDDHGDVWVAGWASGKSGAASGLLRSTDGGLHFTADSPGSVSAGEVNGLYVDGAELFAASWPDGLLHSADGGHTFQSGVERDHLYYGQPGGNKVWGSSGGDVWVLYTGSQQSEIFHSTDHGAHFDDLSWPTCADLTAVVGTGPNDLWITGDQDLLMHSTDGGHLWQHLRGKDPATTWSSISVAGDPANGSPSGSDDELFLSGYQGNLGADDEAPLFGRFTGGAFAPLSTLQADIHEPEGLWTSGPTLAVADAGGVSVSHDGGASFRVWDSGEGVYPTTVWGADPNDLFLVGSAGLLVHSRDGGQSWSAVPSGTTDDLTAVWGSGKNDVWVVGGATALHSEDDGASWHPASGLASAIDFRINAAWGPGPHDIYLATGSDSDASILHSTNDGKTFSVDELGGWGIRALWGSGPHDVWAVGERGTIFHHD